MGTQSGSGSLIIRRSLGRRLKALRNEAGKSAADVTAAQIASRSKLFKIEAGSVPVRMADVRALCWLYGADHATTDQLADLALNTASDGWWEDYADALPRWFTTYVELEEAATSASKYEPELVPGLLQTADYHRAVFDSDPLAIADQANRQVALRSDRQRAAFTRPTPLRLTAVISQGALDREVGGAKVMDEQRAHLLSHQAEIRVLPASIGAHAAMRGPFTILDFADPDDPSVIYLEALSGGRYDGAEATVSAYRTVFAAIVAASIPIEEYLR